MPIWLEPQQYSVNDTTGHCTTSTIAKPEIFKNYDENLLRKFLKNVGNGCWEEELPLTPLSTAPMSSVYMEKTF